MGIEGNSKVKEYVDSVCSYVKYREAHKEIKQELICHVEDIVDEYTEEDMPYDEALDNAIQRMGNVETVGKQLNKAHKGTPDWITLVLTIILVNISTALMYFICYNSSPERKMMYSKDIFTKSVFYSVIGTVIMITLYFFNYKKLEKYSKHIYIGMCILMISFPFTAVFVNGRPYLKLGPFTINIISISPYIFIIALAGIFNNYDWNKKINLLKAAVYLIVPIFFMLQNHSFTACGIYFAAFLILCLRSGMNKRHALFIILANVFLFMWLIISGPYYIFLRLTVFRNPYADGTGLGYTNVCIDKILHSSVLFGHGVIPFDNRLTFLPEIHLEFIFSYIVYTFGFMGAAVVIAIIISFIWRIFHISKYIYDSYGKLLIHGLLSIFIVQFIINILMNVNMFPIMGISLPFISYGGSLCLLNMISIGIILSVYRRRSLGTFDTERDSNLKA